MRGKSRLAGMRTKKKLRSLTWILTRSGSKTLEKKSTRTASPQTCRASERQSRKRTAQTIL